MLREEQVAELLQRVEQILGKELPQIRGNLRVPENRAAAVWELVVTEAASYLGSIEYEPEIGESPDIRLQPPRGRKLWIEAVFLYPRFWKKERQSNEVSQWLYEEAEQKGIPAFKIRPRFDGKPGKSGPVRVLPAITERKTFLKEPEIVKWFKDITSKPTKEHYCTFSKYTVSISYLPNTEGPYRISGGPQQEQPKIVKEHALYRALNEKARKQKVSGPKIICIGSDQSPALSPLTAPGLPTVRDAVRAVLNKNSSISAVIVVLIQTSPRAFGQTETLAHGDLYANDYAEYRLTEEEASILLRMDFNRWKYALPLVQWGETGAAGFERASGSLICMDRGESMEIEIPVKVLVDALAGKTNLLNSLPEDHPISRVLNDGWEVKSCTMKAGNIEAGEGPKIVLEFSSPILSALLSTKRK